LLLFCQKAQFIQAPIEQSPVAKLKNKCDQTPTNHFTPKPLLHFNFAKETVPLVLAFLNSLDRQADYYDMEEAESFYDPRFKDLSESRNAYLNQWQLNVDEFRKEHATAN
jgi:hypothetical protein